MFNVFIDWLIAGIIQPGGEIEMSALNIVFEIWAMKGVY